MADPATAEAVAPAPAAPAAAPAAPGTPAAPAVAPGAEPPATIATLDPAVPPAHGPDGKTPLQQKIEQKWATTWREDMAGGDEKLLKRLARYAEPGAVAKGLGTLLARMEAGEFVKPLAKDATDDEIKAYRTANGIPETPDKYEMPAGLQISEADKPIIDEFLKFSHGSNKPPGDVKATIDWFYKAQEQQKEQQKAADDAFHDQGVGELKADWGQDYNRNVNGLRGFVVAQAGEKMFADLFGARLASGTLAGDTPGFLKFMTGLMLEVNPAATLVNGGGVNPLTDITAEKARIENLMRTDRAAYDRDPKNAQRYMELVDAELKLKSRAA